MITRDGKVHLKLSLGLAMAINKEALPTSQLAFNLRNIAIKYYIWSIAVCGAEIWTLLAVDRECCESFEMWCCSRMEKISWTDRV